MLLASKLAGGRWPRWLVQMAAGLAIIGVTISNECTWLSRTSAALLKGIEVAEIVEKTAFYLPWSYAFPYIHRFVAVDVGTMKSQPGQHLADLYFFGHWTAIQQMSVLIDCPGARRAPVPDGASFDAQGALTNAAWISAPKTTRSLPRPARPPDARSSRPPSPDLSFFLPLGLWWARYHRRRAITAPEIPISLTVTSSAAW